ncbi:hypothetical protein ACQR3P_31985 [Rhodococcus sp. IEGM1300]
MPIVIKTTNEKEYVVKGEYSLAEFRAFHMREGEDYIEFHAEHEEKFIPTILMRSNVISIQEFSKEDLEQHTALAFFD